MTDVIGAQRELAALRAPLVALKQGRGLVRRLAGGYSLEQPVPVLEVDSVAAIVAALLESQQHEIGLGDGVEKRSGELVRHLHLLANRGQSFIVEKGFVDAEQVAVTQQLPVDELERFFVAAFQIQSLDQPERPDIDFLECFAVLHRAWRNSGNLPVPG